MAAFTASSFYHEIIINLQTNAVDNMLFLYSLHLHDIYAILCQVNTSNYDLVQKDINIEMKAPHSGCFSYANFLWNSCSHFVLQYMTLLLDLNLLRQVLHLLDSTKKGVLVLEHKYWRLCLGILYPCHHMNFLSVSTKIILL